MKTKIIFLLMIPIIIISCAKEKKSPIEGDWQYISGKYFSGDSLANSFPGTFTGSSIKIWSKDHFLVVGNFNHDTTNFDIFGGGTYTLSGDQYEEDLLYHSYKKNVGKSIKMLLEIRNDTLTQTWPLDEDGQIDKSNYNIEKFIRLD